MKHITINNVSRFFVVLPLALGSCVLLSSCGGAEKKEEKHTTATEEAPAVQAFILQKGKLAASIQIPGELIPYQQVDIYAKVNGFVKKLYADVGTEVKMGQLLAVMEAPELSSQLAGADSRWASAKPRRGIRRR